jgi:hypothetical protein
MKFKKFLIKCLMTLNFFVICNSFAQPYYSYDRYRSYNRYRPDRYNYYIFKEREKTFKEKSREDTIKDINETRKNKLKFLFHRN